jgi:hypothetical protein
MAFTPSPDDWLPDVIDVDAEAGVVALPASIFED